MTTPLNFTTTITDRGALALLDSLSQALVRLSQAQATLAAASAPARNAQGQFVKATQDQINATKQAAAAYQNAVGGVQALQQASATYARNAKSASQQQQQLTRDTVDFNQVVRNLAEGLTGLFATFIGVDLFRNFLKQGIQFDQTIETATLGIASLIDAEADLRDADGRLLTGTNALNGALILSADQVTKLRIQGIQTAATTLQLVDAFQQAVGSGLAAGLTLDQIRKITVQIVQAATAIGVPMNQLNQEVRSILDATIDRNSRVAKVLAITNQEVVAAKEQGKLQEFLNTKLEAFTTAGVRAQQTMQVLKSNIVEAIQTFAGASVQPFFDKLKAAGLTALSEIFDLNNARVAPALTGLVSALNAVFGSTGTVLASGITAAVNGAKELSHWFDENHAEIVLVADAMGQIVEETAGLISDIIGVIGKVVEWGIETGVVRATFQGIADIISFIRAHPLIVGTLVGGAALVTTLNSAAVAATVATTSITKLQAVVAAFNSGGILAAARLLVNPWVLAAAALAALGIEIERFVHQRDLELQKATDINTRYGQNTATAISLAREYRNLQTQINSNKLSQDELADAQKNQQTIMSELEKAGIREQDVMKDSREQHISITQAIDEEIKKRIQLLNVLAAQNLDKLFEAEDERKALLAGSDLIGDQTRAKLQKDPFADLGQNDHAPAVFRDQLNAANKAVVTATQNLGALREALKLVTDAEAAAAQPSITPHIAPDTTKAAKALNDLRQQTRAEIEVIKSDLALYESALKDALDQGQISYTKYHETIVRESQRATDEQIALLNKLRSKTTDKGDQSAIDAQITALQNDRLKVFVDNQRELADQLKKLDEQVAAARVQRLKDSGNAEAAALAEIDAKYKDTIKRLKLENTPESLAKVIEIDKLIDVEKLKVRLDAVRAMITSLKNDTEAQLNELANRVQTGSLTEAQARRQTVDVLNSEKLALLGARDGYQELADATGDPGALKAVELLSAAINTLNGKITSAKQATHELRDAFIEAIQSQLSDFFSEGIAQAKSLGDAFRALALGVVQAIQQIIAQILAWMIIQRTAKALGFTITGKGPFGFKEGGLVTDAAQPSLTITPLHYATGGVVRVTEQRIVQEAITRQERLNRYLTQFTEQRYASGGSVAKGPSGVDRVPAWLTLGEYVIRREKVIEYGEDFFDDINYGAGVTARRRKRGIRGYATGGTVEPINMAANNTDQVLGRLEVALGAGLETRLLKSRPGRRAILQVLQENPNAVSNVLGRKR